MAQSTQTQPQPNLSPKARKKRRRLSSTHWMFALILAIGLMLAVNFSNRIADDQALQVVHDTLSREIELLRSEQAALALELDYVRGDAYVEAWARSEGKMVRPGDVLIIPRQGETLTAAQREVVDPVILETTPEEPTNWMVWWALFFDEPPPLPGSDD